MSSPMRIRSAEDPLQCEKLTEYFNILRMSKNTGQVDNICSVAYAKERCRATCKVRDGCESIFMERAEEVKKFLKSAIATNKTVDD